jgi:hypothetical protein
MIRWTPNTPVPTPQRWQSRGEILKAYLDSLSPLELLRVRPDYYALTYGWDFEKRRYAQGRLALYEALEERAGFNPNQPRVPAGSRDGGQWTSGRGSSGGSGLVAYADVGEDPEAASPNPLNPEVQFVAAKVTIDYSDALTGISRIDDTTKALVGTLAAVVAILPEGSGPPIRHGSS